MEYSSLAPTVKLHKTSNRIDPATRRFPQGRLPNKKEVAEINAKQKKHWKAKYVPLLQDELGYLHLGKIPDGRLASRDSARRLGPKPGRWPESGFVEDEKDAKTPKPKPGRKPGASPKKKRKLQDNDDDDDDDTQPDPDADAPKPAPRTPQQKPRNLADVPLTPFFKDLAISTPFQRQRTASPILNQVQKYVAHIEKEKEKTAPNKRLTRSESLKQMERSTSNTSIASAASSTSVSSELNLEVFSDELLGPNATSVEKEILNWVRQTSQFYSGKIKVLPEVRKSNIFKTAKPSDVTNAYQRIAQIVMGARSSTGGPLSIEQSREVMHCILGMIFAMFSSGVMEARILSPSLYVSCERSKAGGKALLLEFDKAFCIVLASM